MSTLLAGHHLAAAAADHADRQPADLVSVANLSVRFTGRHPVHAVRGLTLTIGPGEAVAIVGESGSGKSVTARTLVGLAGPGAQVTAEEFHVAGLDGQAATERDWRRLRGGTVGFVLQDALTSLDPLRTIGQEITEVLAEHRIVPRRDYGARVVHLLADVGMDEPVERARQHSHQLSGGLRQRALIASALAGEPGLLIVDEPTTALDVTVQAQILDLLAERRRRGSALLVISHDLAVVAQLADRVLVLRDGVVVEQGPTAQVLAAPRHDYTRALIAAIPSADSRGRRLSGLRIDAAKAVAVAGFRTSPKAIGSQPVAYERSNSAADSSTATALAGLGHGAPGVGQGAPEPARSGPPILAAQAVSKSFRLPGGGLLRAVSDVSLNLYFGQKLGIVGESGSGKSTLARLLLGLVPPDTGSVTVGGHEWSGGTAPRRSGTGTQLRDSGLVSGRDRAGVRAARRRIQFIAQDSIGSFDPRYTVEDIVAEPLRGIAPTAEIGDRVADLLDLVALPGRVRRVSPRLLSGGQAQRVAIARALALRPAALICDEPVSALDVSIQAQILDLLDELNAATGTALAFISHDLGVVRHLVDQVLVMSQGHIVEQGQVEEVFDAPLHTYTRSLIDAIPELPAGCTRSGQ